MQYAGSSRDKKNFLLNFFIAAAVFCFFLLTPIALLAADVTYTYRVGSWDEALIYNTSYPTSYSKNIFNVPVSGLIDKIEVTANLIAGWSITNENKDIILRLKLPDGSSFDIWNGDWPSSGEHEYTKTVTAVNGRQMAGTWNLTFTSLQNRDNNLLLFDSDMFGLHSYGSYDDAFQQIRVKIYYLDDWPSNDFNVKYYNKYNNFSGTPDAVENISGLGFSYSNWDTNSPVVAGKRIGTWKNPDSYFGSRGAYNDFSIRYQSNPVFETANYYFNLQADDKISFYLDSTLIDTADWASPALKQVKRYMTAGRHKIQLDYFQGCGYSYTSFSFAKDQTPPANASINGPDYASGPQVTVTLSAADFFGVTGYSTNIDSNNLNTWVTVPETPNFSTVFNMNIGSSEGTHTVYARFKDKNGNISAAVSHNITIDHSAPVCSIQIEGGAGYTNKQTVSFQLDAQDAYSNITHYAVSETPNISGNSTSAPAWIALPNSKNITAVFNYTFINNINANKTIYVWVKDVTGNISAAARGSIILDTAAPYDVKIFANSGATWAKDVNLTLNLHAGDSLSPVKYYFYSELPAPPVFLWKAINENLNTFNKNENYSLGVNASDGLKVIYAWYKDAAGNISVRCETSIVLDRTAPYEVSGKVIINNDYPYTIARAVTLKVNAIDPNNAPGYAGGVCGYYISESYALPDLNDARWKNISPPAANYINNSIPYNIAGPEGITTVYAYFKDAAGNISNVVSDTIELDLSNPAGSVKINSGSQFTNNNEAVLNLTANDGSGITGFFISQILEIAPALTDAGWIKCAAVGNLSRNYPYKFDETNGEKKINVWYRDGAGNISNKAAAKIILDSAPPEHGTGEVEVTTIAGTGLAAENNSLTPALETPISAPFGICLDRSGDLYFTTDKNTVKKIRTDGMVETIAGSALAAGGQTNGYAAVSRFNKPCGIIIDNADNIFICDYNNNLIRQITNSTGYTMNFSGSAYAGDSDGTLSGAAYKYPCFIQLSGDGTFYLTDRGNKKIKKIYKDINGNYMVASVTGSIFNNISGIAVTDDNNIFVCDSGDNLIKKISFNGQISTYAGAIDAGYSDGAGINAKFNSPSGMAADKYGNIFAADSKNNLIRKISTTGAVTTIAGASSLLAGYNDGPGSAAQFNFPAGIAVSDNGTIYTADSKNNRIRKIASIKGRGLDINHGSRTASEKNIVLSLAACDDYGISGYYISTSADYRPPVSADTAALSSVDGTANIWHNLNLPLNSFTAEVTFELDSLDDPRVIYVWYKDKAGNISIAGSKDVNQKYMRIISSHGTGYLSNPSALAADSYSNLWVIDRNNPAIYQFNKDLPGTRFGTSGTGADIESISLQLTGISVNSINDLLIAEKDKSRVSYFITNEVTLNQKHFVNSIEKTIFLISNIFDCPSVSVLRNSINDKYTAGINYSAVKAVFNNLTSVTAAPEKNFKIKSVELYNAPGYLAANKITSIPKNQKIYVSATGSGSESSALKSITIEVISQASSEKLSFSLLETGIGSNKYRSEQAMSCFQAGNFTDCGKRIIAAKSGDYIIIRDLNGDYSQKFMVQ